MRTLTKPAARQARHSGCDYGYKMDLAKVFRDYYGVNLFLDASGEPRMTGNMESIARVVKWVDTHKQYVIDRLLENSGGGK